MPCFIKKKEGIKSVTWSLISSLVGFSVTNIRLLGQQKVWFVLTGVRHRQLKDLVKYNPTSVGHLTGTLCLYLVGTLVSRRKVVYILFTWKRSGFLTVSRNNWNLQAWYLQSGARSVVQCPCKNLAKLFICIACNVYIKGAAILDTDL